MSSSNSAEHLLDMYYLTAVGIHDHASRVIALPSVKYSRRVEVDVIKLQLGRG